MCTFRLAHLIWAVIIVRIIQQQLMFPLFFPTNLAWDGNVTAYNDSRGRVNMVLSTARWED